MPTVKDLKKLAKERGLRGYSKLRKAELLSLLKKTIPAPRTIPRKGFSRLKTTNSNSEKRFYKKI